MTSILLLEDDSSLGATLSERLQKESYAVVWCRSLSEAKEALSRQSYDLAILDVGLPDGSGFDLAREIRKGSLMPFIFVTALGSAEDRLCGYEIGAEEYIPKPFHLKELMLRVEHVLKNHASEVIELASGVIDLTAMEIRRGGSTEKLNFKETAILKLLINRSPNPVSRDEILNAAWGEEEYPSNRTVDNVIVRIRQALGDQMGQSIHSVRGVGYKWSTDKEAAYE